MIEGIGFSASVGPHLLENSVVAFPSLRSGPAGISVVGSGYFM